MVAPDSESARLESAWQRMNNRLEDERHLIYEEIKSYPTPITGCDVQFSHLLEQQTNVFEELARLHRAREESLQCSESAKRLEEFLGSSQFMDQETTDQIRALLSQV
jgi:hypothetical protein